MIAPVDTIPAAGATRVRMEGGTEEAGVISLEIPGQQRNYFLII